MDFSKLSANEKLAVYGAIASIVGPLLSSFGFGFGVGWLTLLLALAMLFIVFQPQIAPQTQLPGTKGSLMLLVGGIAAASAALALLASLGWLGLFGANAVFVIGWLIGIAGGLLMGWAGWQEFQAEGGKFQIGTAGTGSTTPGTTAPSAPAPPPPAPSAEAAPPPTAEPAPTPPPAAETTAADTTPAANEDDDSRMG